MVLFLLRPEHKIANLIGLRNSIATSGDCFTDSGLKRTVYVMFPPRVTAASIMKGFMFISKQHGTSSIKFRSDVGRNSALNKTEKK